MALLLDCEGGDLGTSNGDFLGLQSGGVSSPWRTSQRNRETRPEVGLLHLRLRDLYLTSSSGLLGFFFVVINIFHYRHVLEENNFESVFLLCGNY